MLEAEMEKNKLNLYVSSRCGAAGFLCILYQNPGSCDKRWPGAGVRYKPLNDDVAGSLKRKKLIAL